MEILYSNCAGLDVHKKTVKVCLLTHASKGQPQKEFRTYLTTTEELLKLCDWLKEQGCTHIAFEATGVYWKPVFNLLEGSFEVLVVNAQHIKAVPGRKTDVKDAEWIADLLQHGLLKASFIPSGPQRELRDLTRYRVRLTEEKAREVNRVQKTLEDMNLKLGDVVSDIMGKASRMILQTIVDGETDPGRLAALAVGRVHASQEQLEAALRGHVTDHHRFLLSEHLTQIHHLEQVIERVSAEIVRRFTPPPPEDGTSSGKKPEAAPEMGPDSESPSAPQAALSWSEAVTLLSSILGIGERSAIGILAEIGRTCQPTQVSEAPNVRSCPSRPAARESPPCGVAPHSFCSSKADSPSHSGRSFPPAFFSMHLSQNRQTVFPKGDTTGASQMGFPPELEFEREFAKNGKQKNARGIFWRPRFQTEWCARGEDPFVKKPADRPAFMPLW